ncbi:glycoside hydrolase family 30 beta sandwich domain-containing protein [Streptomyces sp. M19]
MASATQGSEAISNVSYVNPDGTRVSVVLNSADTAHTFSITENGESFSYELPAGSVATFTWPEEAAN